MHMGCICVHLHSSVCVCKCMSTIDTCMGLCMFWGILVYICAYTFGHPCMQECIYMQVCSSVKLCMYIHICAYGRACVQVCLSACRWIVVCRFACSYTSEHSCIHTYLGGLTVCMYEQRCAGVHACECVLAHTEGCLSNRRFSSASRRFDSIKLKSKCIIH